jgi:uncharacterized protein YecT (DUF1311 family)
MWLRRTSFFCLPVLLLGLAGVRAEGADTDDVCADAENNVALKACLAKAYEQADKELNAVWKQVLASVDQADHLTAEQREAWKTELREAQRSWVAFKEHDCNGAVLYEWWGGSGAGGAISSCLLGHTADRTADLEERYLDR